MQCGEGRRKELCSIIAQAPYATHITICSMLVKLLDFCGWCEIFRMLPELSNQRRNEITEWRLCRLAVPSYGQFQRPPLTSRNYRQRLPLPSSPLTMW